MDEKKKSSMVDQMMAAMARKNAQHYPETKNADGTVKATKPRRGTGPVPRRGLVALTVPSAFLVSG